ncbi:hypothetical protein J2T09_003564 [Neorhizobium huautlense]|uniref:Uncharacterized protein n=1 Tax=Neorhizobium huautlense TaxID=67774 RepID=A0ABT9PWK7_9HYPH|nr:hypothetical protein [Neorhizobium huautlense]
MISALQLSRQRLCLPNIPFLRALVAAAQEDINDRTLPNEINAIAGTVIYPQFIDTVADGFDIARIVCCEAPDAFSDAGFRPLITETVKPIREFQRFPNGEYGAV